MADPGPFADEQLYVCTLLRERRHYAWVLRHHGGRDVDRAEADAAAFYRYEGPEERRRGIEFHDLAWHWAMLEIHGEHYWRDHPERTEPPPQYWALD